MAEEVVVHVDVGFAADRNVRPGPVAVGKVIKGEDYGAVGGVLERDNAKIGVAPLYGVEYFCGRGGGRPYSVCGDMQPCSYSSNLLTIDVYFRPEVIP